MVEEKIIFQVLNVNVANLKAVLIVGVNVQLIFGRDEMLNGKRALFNDTYKCRLSTAKFSNPEELRIHRIVNHKGHMLTLKIKA